MKYKIEEIRCLACAGRGCLANTKEFKCKKCNGSGRVEIKTEIPSKPYLIYGVILAVIIIIVCLVVI